MIEVGRQQSNKVGRAMVQWRLLSDDLTSGSNKGPTVAVGRWRSNNGTLITNVGWWSNDGSSSMTPIECCSVGDGWVVIQQWYDGLGTVVNGLKTTIE